MIAATTPVAASGRASHRVDGIFGEVGALFLRALPGALGEHLGAKPLLKLLRRGHDPRPAALDLGPRGGDFRRVLHRSRLSR